MLPLWASEQAPVAFESLKRPKSMDSNIWILASAGVLGTESLPDVTRTEYQVLHSSGLLLVKFLGLSLFVSEECIGEFNVHLSHLTQRGEEKKRLCRTTILMANVRILSCKYIYICMYATLNAEQKSKPISPTYLKDSTHTANHVSVLCLKYSLPLVNGTWGIVYEMSM